MIYTLGNKSRTELFGVHPDLVRVVERAIAITTQDFAVHDGLRTPEGQAQLIASGASHTLKSKHLPQADGFSHAVDLVPYINGKLRWEWSPIFKIAVAVDTAAAELGIELRWGGVWDRRMSDYGGSPEAMNLAVADYCARHPGPDFIDGPHFELIS
jgi:peptidoglycan LD-endopeptidase CwlK